MRRRTPSERVIVALALGVLSLSATPQEAGFTPRPSSQEFEQATPESVQNESPAALSSSSEASADPNRLMPVRLTDVGQEAIRGGEVRWSVLVVAAGLLISLAVGISLHRRLTGKPSDAAPGEAFVAYARRLGLSWRQILLLARIARSAKLPTPLTLLVASGPLYHHGRQFAAGFSMTRRDRIHRSISAIHRKAFPHTLRAPRLASDMAYTPVTTSTEPPAGSSPEAT